MARWKVVSLVEDGMHPWADVPLFKATVERDGRCASASNANPKTAIWVAKQHWKDDTEKAGRASATQDVYMARRLAERLLAAGVIRRRRHRPAHPGRTTPMTTGVAR